MKFGLVGVVLLIGAAIAGCADDEVEPQLEHGVLSVDQAVAAAHVACLDVNKDHVLSPRDQPRVLQGGSTEGEADPVDLNADGIVDARDGAFLSVDLRLVSGFDYAVCGDAPIEYLVGSEDVPAIDCATEERGVIVVAIGGGAVDLRTADNAAGVRWIANGLLDALDDGDYQTVGVATGPALAGMRANPHAAMETWLTTSVRTFLEQFPCSGVVLLGHSHGAVTAGVVGARLEGAYADRIILVVPIDRETLLYEGDTQARPSEAAVFNVYQTTDEEFPGEPYEAPNVENWDASGVEGPANGEEGGKLEPVNHTTIDNSPAVRDRIIDEVMERIGE